ncbi:phospholipid-binding protein MlaC [Alkalilimnicola sp. S0819]|uniref:MlaC/ttg2D family ABC transporter substrate-binding protein n=1 Tax=Alkalilimnicola sp. S0819 TaxID=2613922 RepID=UPI001261CC29|nr:ABC transporter substrate-binding protein [Alkalilimnicola sp. S0819]KAB7623830.1 ABC transporter substrate-binding protein [Alkalilimnicola sp. S0819]MPQ16705.1 ABC transporter substrate-binding protein [Alkalilimnicola sp. S0819]
MKRVFWLLLSLLLAAAPAQAQETAPDALVRDTAERMLEVLRERRGELDERPQMVFDLVEEIVLPHFDFELMSRYVLARNWRGASDEQRSRFVEEFRHLLVRTYATSLAEYSGQRIEYLPLRGDPARGRVTVSTVIKQNGGGPDIPVDYNLRRTESGWKVFDVIIEGLSLVQNYRGSFASAIRRQGLDGLIDDLAARNANRRDA